MYCTMCGALNRNGANFCISCGRSMTHLQQQSERQQQLQVIADGNIDMLPTVEDVPLVLRKNDRCIIALPNVQLCEERMVREYVGGSRGVSIRVMKGVSYRVGNFAGQSVSRPEIKQVDMGTLYVTTKRFDFSGSRMHIDIPLSKIESLEMYSDGIQIGRSGKQRKEYYVGVDGPYVCSVIAGAINSWSA